MVVDTQAILNLVAIVGDDAGVKRTVKESAKGAATVGIGAFLGALMGGPPGMLIGGILSSIATYVHKKNDFGSLKEAIESMPFQEKEMVAQEMNLFISQLEVSDVALLTAMCVETMNAGGIEALVRNPVLNSLRQNAIRVVTERLTNA